MRTKFHSINKIYSLIDPKHTEKIDKENFRKLFEKFDLNLEQAEIDLLWRDFDADLIPFSNLMRRFFMPDEFYRFRNGKYKKQQGIFSNRNFIL